MPGDQGTTNEDTHSFYIILHEEDQFSLNREALNFFCFALFLLSLVLTNMDGLVTEVKVRSSLGCSDHEMVEFKIQKVRLLLWTLEEPTLISPGPTWS